MKRLTQNQQDMIAAIRERRRVFEKALKANPGDNSIAAQFARDQVAKLSRQIAITKGALWHVHKDGSEKILKEGTRAVCLMYIKQAFGMQAYQIGRVRLGQIIWEHPE